MLNRLINIAFRTFLGKKDINAFVRVFLIKGLGLNVFKSTLKHILTARFVIGNKEYLVKKH